MKPSVNNLAIMADSDLSSLRSPTFIQLLKKGLIWVKDTIAEDFGYPATLIKNIENKRISLNSIDPQKKNVSLYSVTRWEQWPYYRYDEKEKILGWKWIRGLGYSSERINLTYLNSLVKKQTRAQWSCEIQQIEGLGASKSDLSSFETLDELVETNSTEMIYEISHELLKKNLAHREIRIIHSTKTSDHFEFKAWDGRLFLSNTGGSHHLCAARYIAKRLDVEVPLAGKLIVYRISRTNLDSLLAEYSIFAISNEGFHHFRKTLESFRAPYLECDLPTVHREARAIFLSKHNKRANAVAKILQRFEAFNIGNHLEQLCDIQLRNLQKLFT